MVAAPLQHVEVFPSREERARAILASMPAVADDGFGCVLSSLVSEAFRASVEARARAVAPSLLGTPFFEQKLRAGFSVYAALGVSAIACSSTRPAWLGAGASAASALGLSSSAISSCARYALRPCYRWFCARALDRVAMASALILVLDEIFDDELGTLSPAARLAAIVSLVDGAPPLPGSACAAFAASLVAGLRGTDDRWAPMAARLCAWAEAELRLEAGGADVEDRQAGIEVSMELLGFALPGVVGDRELRWMQGIALLGQMVDDVVDVEKDLAAGRVTHGATGRWTPQTIAELYATLVADTRGLVVSGGERHEPTLVLYERTVRGQLRHMAEVLIAHP